MKWISSKKTQKTENGRYLSSMGGTNPLFAGLTEANDFPHFFPLSDSSRDYPFPPRHLQFG